MKLEPAAETLGQHYVVTVPTSPHARASIATAYHFLTKRSCDWAQLDSGMAVLSPASPLRLTARQLLHSDKMGSLSGMSQTGGT